MINGTTNVEGISRALGCSTVPYVDGQRIEMHKLGDEDGASEGQIEIEGKNNGISSNKERYYITEVQVHVI